MSNTEGKKDINKTLTAAVIGLNWGVRMHVAVLQKAGWQVKMLCGRQYDRTSKAALQYGIEDFTINIEEVLERNYDLIVIAVPWYLHSFVYSLALQSNSHLLVEHPLSVTVEEAIAIARQAESRKQFSWINFPSRYMEPSSQLYSLLSDGKIGKIKRVEHTFHYPLDEEREWLPLLTMHSLDLANWLFELKTPLDATASEISIQNIDSCPSWSWPLCFNGTTITLELLKASFSLQKSGTYTLAVGHYEGKDFVETIFVEGDTASAGYESRLNRENEFSPWAISPVWLSKFGAEPNIKSAKIIPRNDAWFEAHVLQVNKIAEILKGKNVPNVPASFLDGVQAQNFLEQLIKMSVSINTTESLKKDKDKHE
jgi:predicted dehydrogenase